MDSQAQQPGLGEALVRQLAEYFQARGRSFMDLSVMHDNRPAIRLYQSLGFVVARVRRSYYADAGEDGLEMVLKLDELAQNGSGVADTTAVK